MSDILSKFEGHIPDSIRQDNKPLEKFLLILEGMLKLRKDEIFKYIRTFMYPLVSDMRSMRRYVDEWGAEYTENSSKECLDCLYQNYFEIYSRKGTELGLIKLLECLFWVEGNHNITINSYVRGKPLILFDEARPYDWLPSGQDIANEVLAPVGEEVWCPTLLDDTWLYQKATLDVLIDIDYTPTTEYLDFIKSVILLYLPMISKDFIIINLNII